MTATRTISAESILDLSEQAAALPAVLSGVLDTRIAELKKLKADLDAKTAIAKTVDAANKLLEDAKTKAAALVAQAEVDANSSRVAGKAVADTAASKLAEADKRAQEVEATARTLASNVDAYNRNNTALMAAIEANNATARALDVRKATLDADVIRMNDLSKKLTARLDALKITI